MIVVLFIVCWCNCCWVILVRCVLVWFCVLGVWMKCCGRCSDWWFGVMVYFSLMCLVIVCLMLVLLCRVSSC